MAVISNQATLRYGTQTFNSNVATGELLDPLAVTKSSLQTDYTDGSHINYVINVSNNGGTPATGLTLTDDLGGYTVGTSTVYPLTYVDGSLRMFVNGVPTTVGLPTVASTAPLTLTGVNVPANSNVMFIFETDTNEFTPLGTAGTVNNTASLTAPGRANPIESEAAVRFAATPQLQITKAMDPVTVTQGDPVTYTFTIQNFGAVPTQAGDNIVLNDTFNPILNNLSATLNGVTWDPANYSYNPANGEFVTLTDFTVPAATYTQDPVTGAYSTVPGTAVITVTGTV